MSPRLSQTRVISSLASLYILRMLGLFMVLPVMSLAGSEYEGSSIALLGVALGIYGLTQAMLQIPFGLLSDRYGRKPLIFIGLILFAAGSVVGAMAETVQGLILGRALQGAGAIAGVVMAMVGDLTSEDNRTKAMASIGASIGIAFAMSLVIGPFIASLELFEETGIRLLFWAAVILSLIGMCLLFTYVPSVRDVQVKMPSLSIYTLKEVLRLPQCLLLYVGVFILHYLLMSIFVVVPLLLEQLSVPSSQHAWVYLGVMLCSFCVMIPMMIVGERKSKVKTLLQISVACLLLVALLMPLLVSHWLLLLLLLLVFFIAFNYLEANLPSLLTKHLPVASKGVGSGVFASSQFLGAALGGIVAGGLYESWGLYGLVVSSVIVCSVWLLLVGKMIIPQRPDKNVIG